MLFSRVRYRFLVVRVDREHLKQVVKILGTVDRLQIMQ